MSETVFVVLVIDIKSHENWAPIPAKTCFLYKSKTLKKTKLCSYGFIRSFMIEV